MSPTEIHKLAVERANDVIPTYTVGSPAHELWLREYDKTLKLYYGRDDR